MGGVSDPLSKSFKEELLAELLIRERVPAPKTPSALSNRLRVLVLSHFLIAFSALLLLFSGFLKNQREIEIFKKSESLKSFTYFLLDLAMKLLLNLASKWVQDFYFSISKILVIVNFSILAFGWRGTDEFR